MTWKSLQKAQEIERVLRNRLNVEHDEVYWIECVQLLDGLFWTGLPLRSQDPI